MGGPKIQCKLCRSIIQSMYRHDFKFCSCGSIYIDGGTDYTRIGGDLQNIESDEQKFSSTK